MTDEEMKEIDRLAAEKFPDVPGMNHLGTREIWKSGYIAACEAKRGDLVRTIIHLGEGWEKAAAQSAKLRDLLVVLRTAQLPQALETKFWKDVDQAISEAAP